MVLWFTSQAASSLLVYRPPATRVVERGFEALLYSQLKEAFLAGTTLAILFCHGGRLVRYCLRSNGRFGVFVLPLPALSRFLRRPLPTIDVGGLPQLRQESRTSF